MKPEIKAYLDEHGGTYTTEALRTRLLEAGHDPADVDEALAEWRATAPPPGGTMSGYVWAIYWLGAALIGVWTVAFLLGQPTGATVGLLGVGWLIAYLALAYFPARALARARTGSAASVVRILAAAPIVVLLIGGGICLATIAVVASSFGG